MCVLSTGKEVSSAGAVDEEDFIRAFEDVPTIQVRPILLQHHIDSNSLLGLV